MSVKTIHSKETSFLSGEKILESQRRTSKHNDGKQTGKKKGVIFAGDLNLKQDDIILNKIKKQKRAMKTILDQYQKDNMVDDNINKIKSHQKELDEELKVAASQYQSLKELRQELKVTYGMTDESEEEVNLSLLEKSIYGDEALTKEELEKLSSMGPLTEYQKTALQYDAMMEVWKERINYFKNGISSDTKSIIGINLELLKTHPMVDAQKEAAKVLEAAIRETIGMLVDETKDKFDEEQEKKAEEAKEKQEKEQEEAEKLQKLKEEKEKLEQNRTEGANAPDLTVTDTVTVETADLEQVRQETLSELMLEARKNLLPEDTKGIAVDEYI
jgi:hypothetical protein